MIYICIDVYSENELAGNHILYIPCIARNVKLRRTNSWLLLQGLADKTNTILFLFAFCNDILKKDALLMSYILSQCRRLRFFPLFIYDKV